MRGLPARPGEIDPLGIEPLNQRDRPALRFPNPLADDARAPRRGENADSGRLGLEKKKGTRKRVGSPSRAILQRPR